MNIIDIKTGLFDYFLFEEIQHKYGMKSGWNFRDIYEDFFRDILKAEIIQLTINNERIKTIEQYRMIVKNLANKEERKIHHSVKLIYDRFIENDSTYGELIDKGMI